MNAVLEYILSVVCTAILCGMIMLLLDKNMPVSGVLKLVLGIVLTITILKPILARDIFSYDLYLDMFDEDGSEFISEGSNVAMSMHRELISQKIQAYILDKAETLGLNITVQVTLQEDNLPESISLSGTVSPYAKKQIEEFISTQLGVRKECLTWR